MLLLCTSWKSRPIGPEAVKRMMEIWGKIEADLAENPDVERLCWYLYSDGSGGFAVNRIAGTSALAFGLETALALEESSRSRPDPSMTSSRRCQSSQPRWSASTGDVVRLTGRMVM